MSSLEELKSIIQTKFGLDPSAIDAHASIREQGLDSLALAELLFEIEDRLHIDLPNDDASIDTLAQLAEWVDRIRAEKAAASVTSAPSA